MEAFLKELNIEIEEKAIQQGRKYFLANKEVIKVKEKINRRPEYFGTLLGEKKKSFHPTPAFIEMLSKKSKNKAEVTEKAEWMFLCGKDVFSENAAGKTSGTVFVQNQKEENLGYGYWTKKKGKKIIKNLLDKGNYLRREN